MNRDRLIRCLCPAIGFFLLALSVHSLQQELDRYDPQEILNSIVAIGDRQLCYALGFAFFSCLAISFYDLIAFSFLKYKLSKKNILFTTFIAYAVSNTTGFTLLIGGGIRYRFYSYWDIPTKCIAKITALGNLTFWLGLSTLMGITLLFNPLQLPDSLNISFFAIRCLGILALFTVAIYLYFGFKHKSWEIKGKTFYFPNPIISLTQIIIFALDWAVAAAILYCLLPAYPDKSYLNFFNVYLVAMATSIISNVPGGVGVFETIIIFLLPDKIAVPNILGSLLIYRALRFLLPLAIALIFIGCFEIKRRVKTSNN